MTEKLNTDFNKYPHVEVQGLDGQAFEGWGRIGEELKVSLKKIKGERQLVLVECYQGVHDDELLRELQNILEPARVFLSRDYFLPEDKILEISHPDLTDHRIFGYMTRRSMDELMDPAKVDSFSKDLGEIRQGCMLVYGPGASLLCPEPDIFIYADMARWEIQLRMRKNEVNNLGISNKKDGLETLYKRGFFFDWRICDRLKKENMQQWDFVLDTNTPGHPKMLRAEALLRGLEQTVQRPFSLVPYFDAGPWGGYWMKEVCGLDPEMVNSAWCFNCVPEENSLYLQFGKIRFETPSINLVFYQSRKLLGEAVQARFGDEFPIRFDFLDTMGGGNLSLQVHPLTEYIQEKFGMHYTQDESYYLVDAGKDACVYLGLKEGIAPAEMIRDLKKSERKSVRFPDEKYVNQWPAKKHDHFLIPGGTVHCSGKNSMVLEISATPYIFTFKLWDWGRLGMDGKPRPININHGEQVIQWERDTKWTEKNLINRIETVTESEGWKEEKTGLHEREFIETRRHWFSDKVHHNTNGGVQVLCLVQGKAAIVESPTEAFSPFVVHFAETFVVPAAVGEYTIRPYGEPETEECATIKAFVRTNA
ncbi:MAG: class I mannose-6-phosphate isomerase [Bacteroidota bacterium]|nr:class I mannose-6-phosphate isomerase [Bacteroidota bacterium]